MLMIEVLITVLAALGIYLFYVRPEDEASDPGNVRDLKDWNEHGRKIAEHNSRAMTAHYTAQNQRRKFSFDVEGDENYYDAYWTEMTDDLRHEDLAMKVLLEIIELNQQGRLYEARKLYEPAHTPFINLLEAAPPAKNLSASIGNCLIRGPDTFFVQQYAEKQIGMWMIHNDKISHFPNITNVVSSRNRRFTLMSDTSGSLIIEDRHTPNSSETIDPIDLQDLIPKDLSQEELKVFLAPPDFHCSSISICDEGRRILVCDSQYGSVLREKIGDIWYTIPLSHYVEGAWDPDELADLDGVIRFDRAVDAISPNGQYIAMVSRDFGLTLVEVAPGGKVKKMGDVEHDCLDIYSYGYHACFADDSNSLAYGAGGHGDGCTVIVDLTALDETNSFHPTKTLDTSLHTRASAYLPAHMTSNGLPAFVLAGRNGTARCVSENGQVLWSFMFGSSANCIDVCPVSKRILITSLSGMAHLIDPLKMHAEGFITGFNPPHEEKRWAFWEQLNSPIMW